MPTTLNTTQTHCGERLTFDGRKALILPDYDALVVGDLHFEKASYLQHHGAHPIPTYDAADNLARLETLTYAYRPQRVIALGDSFHDPAAELRLSPDIAKRLNGLIETVDKFDWVLGNHDPKIPAQLSGVRRGSVRLGSIYLTHEPADSEGLNICAHFHPKVRFRTRVSRHSCPCFAVSENRVIIPSFGAYTGGLNVEAEAIRAHLPEPVQYLACMKGRIVDVRRYGA